MKHQVLTSLLAAVASAAWIPATQVRAQTAPPAAASDAAASTSSSTNDELIKLPTFEIRSEKDDQFVGNSALSSTRVAVDLSEVPQSVKVLNNSFISAVNPNTASDLLEYVGGGQNGNLNWTPGRMNIRGFTGDADYVDGFSPTSNTVLDESIYDRFEIIKGPNAVFLAADGSPSGIVNKITKSPSPDAQTTLSLQTGIFNGNHAVIDSTGPITTDKKLTFRAIVGETYSNGYYDNTYMHRFTAMGALTYRFSADTKLELKAEFGNTTWPSYNGIPIDPRTHYMLNVPYSSTQDFGAPLNWRNDFVRRLWANYSSRLNQYLAVSVRGMRASDHTQRLEAIAPTWSEGTSTGTALINGVSTPVTFLGGKWVTPATVGTSEQIAPANYYVQNGTTYVTDSWAGTPTYAGGAIPRSAFNSDDIHNLYNDLQGDLNFNYKALGATELLLVGFEHRDNPQSTEAYKAAGTLSASPWTPFSDSPNTETSAFGTSAPSAYSIAQSLQNRGYLLETLKVWDDRVILSWGATRASTYAATYNLLTGVMSGTPYNLNTNLVQWGAVVKVLPNVSVFTGFNQNFAANGVGTLGGVPNSVLPPKTGKQHEVGIKSHFLNNRLEVNVSYFDIQQQNNTVPSFPFDPNNPNVLIPGVISRGWDADWSFKVNDQVYLMGSFANYSAKSILGSTFAGAQGSRFLQPGTDQVAYASIPVDNVAEQTESLFALYKFAGNLKGLQVGVGENFQSKRAITDGSNQVFWGYIPKRTLVDALISYRINRQWTVNANIENLFDTKYIYASRSEDVIIPGTPINVKTGVTYTF